MKIIGVIRGHLLIMAHVLTGTMCESAIPVVFVLF